MAEETQNGLSQVPEESLGEVKPPEVSSEELTKQLQELNARIEQQEQIIKKQEKALTSGQSRKESLDQLHTRLDGLEEQQATILDLLAGNVPEPETPIKSHREQLTERRKQQVTPKEGPIDPDVVKFVTFMELQDLKADSPLIQEAVANDRSPKEALDYLRTKVKAAEDAKLEKRASEVAQSLFEKTLKEKGLTASGAIGPSGSSNAWRDLSPTEKIAKGVSGQ